MSVTNIADGAESVQPIIQEYKIVDKSVIDKIISKTETSGPSDEVVKDAE